MAVIAHDKRGLYAARGLVGVGFAGGPDDIIRRVVELLEERSIRLGGEHIASATGTFEGSVGLPKILKK